MDKRQTLHARVYEACWIPTVNIDSTHINLHQYIAVVVAKVPFSLLVSRHINI